MPSKVVDLIMEVIQENTRADETGLTGGISFKRLVSIVKARRKEFLKKYWPATYPGKERIRKIIWDVLAPSGLVEVRLNGVAITGPQPGSTGRKWQILAKKVSREFIATVVGATTKLNAYSQRIENLQAKPDFDLASFSGYESLVKEVSSLPLLLYFDAHRLSTQARWQMLERAMPRARALLDKLLDIRQKLLERFPNLDEILKTLSDLMLRNAVLGRPHSVQENDFSYFSLRIVFEDKLRLPTVKTLEHSIRNLGKSPRISSIDIEPFTPDMLQAWSDAQVLKSQVLKWVEVAA